MSIAVTTPTGNIGSAVVKNLLEAGADLTLLLRNPDKLDKFVRDRVKVQQGEQQDPEFLRSATEGCEALFWLTPNDFSATDLHAWYERLGTGVESAVQANKIGYVVNLSAAGAQLPNAGPVSRLSQIEKHLNATEANVIHLRPAMFMENLLGQLGSLKSQGTIYLPFPSTARMSLVAVRDIAQAASGHLLKKDWTGKRIQGVHGAADLTFDEVTSILSTTLDRPIHYVQVSVDQVRQQFLGYGASPEFADAYVEMVTGLAQPGAIAEPRSAETTTQTTFAQWATQVLKPLMA